MSLKTKNTTILAYINAAEFDQLTLFITKQAQCPQNFRKIIEKNLDYIIILRKILGVNCVLSRMVTNLVVVLFSKCLDVMGCFL